MHRRNRRRRSHLHHSHHHRDYHHHRNYHRRHRSYHRRRNHLCLRRRPWRENSGSGLRACSGCSGSPGTLASRRRCRRSLCSRCPSRSPAPAESTGLRGRTGTTGGRTSHANSPGKTLLRWGPAALPEHRYRCRRLRCRRRHHCNHRSSHNHCQEDLHHNLQCEARAPDREFQGETKVNQG